MSEPARAGFRPEHGSSQGPCVIVTHRIQPAKDAEFLEALQRLHEARRAKGWVTDHWLVLRNRDAENTYTQILEYTSPEAETEANEAPEMGALRREIGKVSAGYPEHVWTAVVRATC